MISQGFFLVRDGVQYQEFLLFTQELIQFTQEILPLLPKKLRTPYSRISGSLVIRNPWPDSSTGKALDYELDGP